MMIRLTWRRIGAALGAAALAGAAFWMAAPYNISARLEHWPPVAYLLHGYMQHTVNNRTLLTDPPPQVDPADPALLRLGAGHFVTGCATCHGAPGVPRNPIVRQMMPEPPYLPETDPLEIREIHWLTYNGLKYTGMPGWAGEGRQDEAWAVAAFVRAIPGMSAETFRELAFADVAPPQRAAMPFGTTGASLSISRTARAATARTAWGATAPRRSWPGNRPSTCPARSRFTRPTPGRAGSWSRSPRP